MIEFNHDKLLIKILNQENKKKIIFQIIIIKIYIIID